MGSPSELALQRLQEPGQARGGPVDNGAAQESRLQLYRPAPEGEAGVASWLCEDKQCQFENSGRLDKCLKCGLPRPSVAKPEAAFQPGGTVQPEIRKLDDCAYAPMASPGVTLGRVEGEEEFVFRVRYLQRLPQVGVVQSPFPMSPGERFSITIHALGTFGKIGLGLAPWRSQNSTMQQVRQARPESHDPGLDTGSPLLHQASAMVGWSPNEVGFHGDHGRWYYMGNSPGKQVSPPWQEGDIVECGQTLQGSVYFLRNGTLVAKDTDGCWPISHAHPTVTFHSGGVELSLGLGRVRAKSLEEFGGRSRLHQKSTLELLNSFKKAHLPDPHQKHGSDLRFSLGWLGAFCDGNCIQMAHSGVLR